MRYTQGLSLYASTAVFCTDRKRALQVPWKEDLEEVNNFLDNSIKSHLEKHFIIQMLVQHFQYFLIFLVSHFPPKKLLITPDTDTRALLKQHLHQVLLYLDPFFWSEHHPCLTGTPSIEE